MRGALGRRIALGAGPRRELHELEAELAEAQRVLKAGDAEAEAALKLLGDRVAALRARVERIPYLDPIDLRYRSRIKVPVPTSRR
jgi:uncharacterized sporulation protein YeaH/YhbH (DUF444 family)